jgi:hypothetical protein
MSRLQWKLALGALALLLVANFIYYFVSGWGLITVKAHDVPVGQIIRSIERQGWVTIYSNIDPQTKVSMYVDHVTLPEAMETLAVNADAQWHLGFFVGPNETKVKSEIRTFTEGTDSSDGTKVYSFPTPIGMLGDDSGDADDDGGPSSSDLPVPDPRKQTWPGVKTPAAPAAPADTSNATASTATPDGTTPPPADPPPSSVQGYLRAFAMGADIWIMSPSDWDPAVSTAPPGQSSIISALDKFVGSMHGSVTQAIVLRGRPARVAGEQRPRNFRGGGGGMDFSLMQDRMDNAINGLPPSYQPIARVQLQKEIAFDKQVQTMPPADRWKAMGKHMLDRRMGMMRRMSPEKRAQMYTRLVGNRMTATGK